MLTQGPRALRRAADRPTCRPDGPAHRQSCREADRLAWVLAGDATPHPPKRGRQTEQQSRLGACSGRDTFGRSCQQHV